MRRTSHKHTLNLTYFIYYAIIQGMSEHFTPQPGEDLTGEQDPMVSGPKPEQHEQEQSPTRLINFLCKTPDGKVVAVVRNPNIKKPSSYREEHGVYIGTAIDRLHEAKITRFMYFRDGGTTDITVQRALPDGTEEDIRLYFPRPEYPFRREGPESTETDKQSNPTQPASPEAAAADLCRQSSRQRGRGRLSQGILWLLGLYYRR